MLAVSSSAWAQSPLPDLSLEDLMKLDAGQVFGASERLQPVIEAPASVSFITAEEIARYGYRTLADILRGVRGMYVTNDRNFSLIGTRGFAKPGDYNSRILLLVNGHRVNDNVFGQAEIGAEFGLDPAMFERVEIIRGPASSLYGDSAFFAVVNVITRTGASLGGGSITVEAGTLGTRLVRAHRGAPPSRTAWMWRCRAPTSDSDGVGRLYFPAFDTPATNNGVAEGLDGEGVKQFYGRLAFNGLTVTGAYGSRRRDVPTASFGTLFNEQESREQTTDRHTLVDAEYGRSFGGTRVTFRASFDRFTYDGTYPFAGEPDGAPTLVGRNSGVGTRWSVGGGLTRAFRGRHTVRAGVEFIDNVHQDQTARYRRSPGAPARQPPLLDAACGLCAGRDQARALAHRQCRASLRRLRGVRAGHAPRGADRPALVDAIGEVPVRQRISRAERIRAERPFYFGDTGQRSAPGVDRHARARVGTLCQRLAAHVRFDLLVQGRPADHARSPTTRRFWASRSSTRGKCGRRASSSKRRCASRENRGRW